MRAESNMEKAQSNMFEAIVKILGARLGKTISNTQQANLRAQWREVPNSSLHCRCCLSAAALAGGGVSLKASYKSLYSIALGLSKERSSGVKSFTEERMIPLDNGRLGSDLQGTMTLRPFCWVL